jgi:hypothetical protein
MELNWHIKPGQSKFWARPPLKQMCLDWCMLHDVVEGLQSELLELPTLQHLSITVDGSGLEPSQGLSLSNEVLQALQLLTFLELSDSVMREQGSMHHLRLQGLTQLQELRLYLFYPHTVTAGMLADLQQLTRLDLFAVSTPSALEPAALLGKTQLQHLMLVNLAIAGGSAGEAQLLSCLQPMHQLSYLALRGSLQNVGQQQPTLP